MGIKTKFNLSDSLGIGSIKPNEFPNAVKNEILDTDPLEYLIDGATNKLEGIASDASKFLIDKASAKLKGILPQEFISNISNFIDNNSDFTSYLGTPVFTNLSLTDGGSNTIQLDAVTVDVSQQRTIVSTKVQGKSGTVKEYVSDADYVITIKGTLASKNTYEYPKSDVKTLLSICTAPKGIKVVSDFLLLFGIHELVIKQYTFDQTSKQGFKNLQPFTLVCDSNIPIELNIDE